MINDHDQHAFIEVVCRLKAQVTDFGMHMDMDIQFGHTFMSPDMSQQVLELVPCQELIRLPLSSESHKSQHAGGTYMYIHTFSPYPYHTTINWFLLVTHTS
jgi:hypothetical protein